MASVRPTRRLEYAHRLTPPQPNPGANAMNILQINASARSNGSESSRLASQIVAGLQSRNPGAQVIVHDLASQPLQSLDEAALGALFTPAEQRTPEQAARVAIDDALIAEVRPPTPWFWACPCTTSVSRG